MSKKKSLLRKYHIYNLLILLFLIPLCGLSGQVIFEEDFESASLPFGWSINTKASDGGWRFGTVLSLDSKFFKIPNTNTSKIAVTNDDECNCNKSADLLITPLFDLTLFQKLAIQFDAFFGANEYNGAKESLKVFASTNGGQNWQTIGVIGETNGWELIKFDASSVAGHDSVMFAINYSDANGWLFGAAIDNVVLQVPLKRDIQLQALSSKPYAKKTASKPIKIKVFNNGSDTITSFGLSWSYKAILHSEFISGINLKPYSSGVFSYTVPFIFGEGIQVVTLNIYNPNGSNDQDTTNNELVVNLKGYDIETNRGVLFELSTGTWCSFCPAGIVTMEAMRVEYGNQFVGVEVHDDDPMADNNYDAGITAFIGSAGQPSIIMDRKELKDPEEIELEFLKAASVNSNVTLTANASYKSGTRNVIVDVSAISQSSINGSQFFIALSENDVTGISSGYAQSNAYAGGSEGIMGGFELLPDPVPASSMIYNSVAREILGGFNGISGSIQSPLPANIKVSYQYSGYTVPPDFDITQMHAIVAILSNGDQVLNVIKVPLVETTATNDVINESDLGISNNPFSESTIAHIILSQPAEVSYKLINSSGIIVQSKDLGRLSGKQEILINGESIPAGLYFLTVWIGERLINRKLVKL